MAVRRPHLAGGCWARVRKSELGRQIAVDLKSDANLYENRGRPSHGASFQPHSPRRFPARLPQGKTPQEPGRYIGLIWHSCKGNQELIMPIVLWLFGVPVTFIIILMLLGAA
jgi:hypothetical protein